MDLYSNNLQQSLFMPENQKDLLKVRSIHGCIHVH